MTLTEANSSIQVWKGLTITRGWKGFGSTLFLDSELDGHKVSVHLGFEWRVEQNGVVSLDWNDDFSDIGEFAEWTTGKTVKEIKILDDIHDLVIVFTSGTTIRTLVGKDADWYVDVNSEKHVSNCDNSLRLSGSEDPFYEVSEQIKQYLNFAEKTAIRWGNAGLSNNDRSCKNCFFFISMNGSFDLMDFGVCSNGKSSSDGSVVFVQHLCDEYSETLRE